MIILVVAHDKNYLIGKNGWMPWEIPEDLKLFKQITLNQKIVMGRKTMESLKKPLPNRFTYVLSNKKDYQYNHENVEVVHDIQKLITQYQYSEESLFVCGGAQIYEAFLPYCDTIYASVVKKEYQGDTYLVDYTQHGFVENVENEYNEFTFKVFEKEE